jgi:transcription elongation GreA/GreB family factor
MDLLGSRIQAVEEAMHAVQHDGYEETKSSAGDKYETGRAMIHLEMEKLSTQREEFLKSKATLDKLDFQKSSDVIQPGSVVLTDDQRFYLAVSLGQISVDGNTYFCISPAAPIGQALLGKRKGDTISFRNQRFKILDVC